MKQELVDSGLGLDPGCGLGAQLVLQEVHLCDCHLRLLLLLLELLLVVELHDVVLVLEVQGVVRGMCALRSELLLGHRRVRCGAVSRQRLTRQFGMQHGSWTPALLHV